MSHDLGKHINFANYHSDRPFLKIRNYQDEWIAKTKFEPLKLEDLNDCLETMKHRFKSSLFYLEILWHQHEIAISDNITDTDSFNFLSLTSLDSFFIQSRSFIDATQNYCLLYLKIEKRHKDLSDFYKKLNRSEKAISKKIETLYKTKVFCDDCFGTDIRKIRDKIIHKTFIKQLNFQDEIRNKIPLIGNKSYEEFCQNFANEVFYFLIEWTELLFDTKWKSG